MSDLPTFSAFASGRLIAAGSLADVVAALQTGQADESRNQGTLVFDNTTGQQVDLDGRGTPAEVAARAQATSPAPAPPASEPAVAADPGPGQRGRGRPRLGVVAREITLLPRHWDWLAAQPGGASVAVRKLVEAARKDHEGRDALRRRQEAVLRFATAMAGNEAGFEEAMRALYAGEGGRFESLLASWPPDVAAHTRRLAQACFAAPGLAG